MTTRIRRVAIITGTTGLIALGSGCGASPESSAAPASGATGQQAAQAGPGGPGGPGNLTGLASRLGVSQAKLQAAIAKVRSGPGVSRAKLDAALAKELGLTAAQVRAAMNGPRPAGGRESGTATSQSQAIVAVN